MMNENASERLESKEGKQPFVSHQLQRRHRNEASPNHEESSVQREGTPTAHHSECGVCHAAVHLHIGGLVHENGSEEVEGCDANGHHETCNERRHELTPHVLPLQTCHIFNLPLHCIVRRHLHGVQRHSPRYVRLEAVEETQHPLMVVEVLRDCDHSARSRGRVCCGHQTSFE